MSQPEREKGSADAMKRSPLLMLIGGMLAAVAFFLPFVVSHPENGVFGTGISLLDGVEHALLLGELRNFQSFSILGDTLFYYEPVAALLLIASGVLTFTGRRAGYLWGLSGALLYLTFL